MSRFPRFSARESREETLISSQAVQGRFLFGAGLTHDVELSRRERSRPRFPGASKWVTPSGPSSRPWRQRSWTGTFPSFGLRGRGRSTDRFDSPKRRRYNELPHNLALKRQALRGAIRLSLV